MAERDGITALKWCLFVGNMFLWVSIKFIDSLALNVPSSKIFLSLEVMLYS